MSHTYNTVASGILVPVLSAPQPHVTSSRFLWRRVRRCSEVNPSLVQSPPSFYVSLYT